MTKYTYLMGGVAAVILASQAYAQNLAFTSQFPIDRCHFSAFGGDPYFILNPGHQMVLKGKDDGEDVVLVITALDQTKEITLLSGGQPRKITTRVIETRETVDGELEEVARGYHARCLETGDVYSFGEEKDEYKDGKITDQEVVWEAGAKGAVPGLIMPGSFLLGARYMQVNAPGEAMDQGENIGMGLTVDTPAGKLENCVQVKEYDGLKPNDTPSLKTYAPGIGLISDDDILKLTEVRLGGTEGLPSGCTLVPYSNNPYFPMSPGHKITLQGEDDGEAVSLTITVLDETKEISLKVNGETRVIQTRIVEEHEEIDGELYEVSRNFYAQCVETGDVYYFGEEVDFYEDGKLVRHDGAWLAGVSGAQPGIIVPGHFVVGARYFQESAPGVATDFAVNAARGVSMTTPAGTFVDCVSVSETNPLKPEEEAQLKTYAPGIGLINDADVLKLTAATTLGTSPVVSIQESILLQWPYSEKAFRVESSADLKTWSPVSSSVLPANGLLQTSVPREQAQRYFRLTAP